MPQRRPSPLLAPIVVSTLGHTSSPSFVAVRPSANARRWFLQHFIDRQTNRVYDMAVSLLPSDPRAKSRFLSRALAPDGGRHHLEPMPRFTGACLRIPLPARAQSPT